LLPSSVVIPENESSVQVDVTTVDNTEATGDTKLTISASAVGHTAAEAEITVLDDDAASLSFYAIATQKKGVDFPVIIQAVDASGQVLTGLNAAVSVTAANTAGDIPLTAVVPLIFEHGVARGLFRINEVASGVVLTATVDSLSVPSVAFDVTASNRDFYTEVFTADKVVDIQNTSFLFTPQVGADMNHFYRVEKESIKELPFPPNHGIALDIEKDNYASFHLPSGRHVKFFGRNYYNLYVSENGRVLFAPYLSSGDGGEVEHLLNPGISAFMSNLAAGVARYEITYESVVVTWSGFKGKQPSGSLNTFQVELFFDGRIRLSYLNLAQKTAIVGFSARDGLIDGFTETDFSSYPTQPVIIAEPVAVAVNEGKMADFKVVAMGEGITYQWRKNGAAIPGATRDRLRINNVQKSDQGNYDVVVSTQQRQQTSEAVELTVYVPLRIIQTPQSQMITEGSPLHLSVKLADATGVRYQWLRNEVPLRGATRSVYALSAAQQVHAGSYTVNITNEVGSLVTEPVQVGILRLEDVVMVQNVGRPLVLTVPAAGSGLEYAWKKDGVTLFNGSHIKGVDQAKLTVADFGDADVADYSCVVKAGTSELESGRFSVRIRHIPIMNSWSTGPWIVSATVDESFSASRDPTSYQVKGLPKGVTQLPGQNRLVGKPSVPGDYTLRITASNAAGVSEVALVPLTVLPLNNDAIGTYEGLILPSAPGTTNNLNGGTLRFTVSSTGACTATALLDGVKTSFTARLDASISAAPTISFTKSGVLSWSGSFNSSGHHLGQISWGDVVAQVEAWKTGVAGVSAYKGNFNAGLTIDPALQADLDYPQGSGHMIFSVSSTGSVAWKGKLADGITVTGSSKLGASGKIPFHHQLYAKGSVAGGMNGWIQLSEDSQGKRIDSDQLLWRKPAQTAKTRSYDSGFAQHTQTLAGRYFDKAVPLLMLSSASPNAVLLLREGKLEQTPPAVGGVISQPIQLDPTKYTATFIGSNDARMKLKITPSTGEFSGSCTFYDTSPARVLSFSGLVIPGTKQGVGQFQLPELPSTLTLPKTTVRTSPILSGKVQFNVP
jgi:hypothetical protein